MTTSIVTISGSDLRKNYKVTFQVETYEKYIYVEGYT